MSVRFYISCKYWFICLELLLLSAITLLGTYSALDGMNIDVEQKSHKYSLSLEELCLLFCITDFQLILPLPCIFCLINGKHLSHTGLRWVHDLQSPFLKKISTVYHFCLKASCNLSNYFGLNTALFFYIKLMMFLEGAVPQYFWNHIIQILGGKKQACWALKY